MLITWYTDPAKGNFRDNPTKFSSLYLYETVSQKFVRVRLELGRANARGDGGETFARYKENRTVGFSTENYSSTDLNRWSIDHDGRLCYDGNALNDTPTEGARTYDCSNVRSFVHKGNPVITEPNLPAGIEAKHLNLIANNVLVNGTDIQLTGSNATPTNLSDALKATVAEIVGKPFDQITDNDILLTLKQQVSSIRNEVLKPNEEWIENGIKEVDALISDINKTIESGIFTPNADVERTFQTLTQAIEKTKAVIATGGQATDIINAINEVKIAQAALTESIGTLEVQKAEMFSNALERTTDAVNNAYDASISWSAIQTEYEKFENSENIEQYEECIDGTEIERS